MNRDRISIISDRIVKIFLAILIFTIPFREYKQTTETICFFVILIAFAVKFILAKIHEKGVHKSLNEDVYEYKITGTPIDLPVLLFTVLVIISIFFSINQSYSLNEFNGSWLRPLLLFYIIVNFANNKRNISYVVGAVVIASLAPILSGLIEYFAVENVRRLSGLFPAPTEFGQYLDYIIPFIFALVLWNKEKFSKIYLGLILAGACFCLLFTYTRASWFSVLIAITFLSFVKSKKFVLIIPAIFVAIFVLFPSQTVRNRVVSFVDDRDSYQQKAYIFKTSARMIKAKPLVGYGWGYKNFHDLYPSFVSSEVTAKNPSWAGRWHAHNYPIQMAFEIGIPGAIVFLWLWIFALVLTWKSFIKSKDSFLKSVSAGLFAAFIACSIHWIVEVPGSKQLVMTLWTFLGIAMAVYNTTGEKWKTTIL